MSKRGKILVPILIILAIMGVFAYKSAENRKSEALYERAQEKAEKTDTNPLEITNADLEGLKTSGVPTMIDFGAKSCGPCKEMAPVLETLHDEWSGRAVVHFMDVWNYSQGLADFPLQVIPTQFFFDKNGEPFIPSKELQEEIEFTIYQAKDTKETVFTAHQGVITEEQMRKIFKEMGVE